MPVIKPGKAEVDYIPLDLSKQPLHITASSVCCSWAGLISHVYLILITSILILNRVKHSSVIQEIPKAGHQFPLGFMKTFCPKGFFAERIPTSGLLPGKHASH